MVEVSEAVQALAQFTARPDESGEVAGSGKYMYWRMPEVDYRGERIGNANYIVIAQSGPVAFQHNIERGLTPLIKYGRFSYPFDAETGVQLDVNPYNILILRGGLKEMPIEQIVEMRWHKYPPVKGLEIPQLKDVEVGDFQCAYCRASFNTEAFLAKHVSVRHQQESGTNMLVAGLAKAQADQQGPLGDVIKLLVQQSAQSAKQMELLAEQVKSQGAALLSLLEERKAK